MKPTLLAQALEFALEDPKIPVLIKGKPGIGKSDIVAQACAKLGYELLIVHPVVEDPTDAKGMPWVVDGKAKFIPFGNLQKMIEANEPLVVFIDDFGQAAPSMQAAYMQLLLNRAINGQPISEEVRFVSATNRREDKAAVGGLLEPVKSRFKSILELDVNTDDWVKWALDNSMPVELIAFVRWKPDMLDNFQPTKDIKNSPSPRTIAAAGYMLKKGLPQQLKYEMLTGAAGEVFASEYIAYEEVWMNLPSIGQIRMNPETAPVPDSMGGKYAVSTMIANELDQKNIEPLYTYLKRLPMEFMAASFKLGTQKTPAACATETFQRVLVENPNMFK